MAGVLDWDHGHFREEARIHEDTNSPAQCCVLSDLSLPELMEGDVNGLLDSLDDCSLKHFSHF
jgi:hypothetical protein